ncbi:hypothetical protein [Sorangium sp. So ce117]|uniref:hypothetical protein n=1 Tax=Sorangium sp. So ce117 TaxID=3133277 RepID=UPI003F62DD5A
MRTFVTLFYGRIAQSDIQPEQEFDELALQASRVEAFVEHVSHDRAEFANVRIDLRVRAEFVRDESQPAAIYSGSAAERGPDERQRKDMSSDANHRCARLSARVSGMTWRRGHATQVENEGGRCSRFRSHGVQLRHG